MPRLRPCARSRGSRAGRRSCSSGRPRGGRAPRPRRGGAPPRGVIPGPGGGDPELVQRRERVLDSVRAPSRRCGSRRASPRRHPARASAVEVNRERPEGPGTSTLLGTPPRRVRTSTCPTTRSAEARSERGGLEEGVRIGLVEDQVAHEEKAYAHAVCGASCNLATLVSCTTSAWVTRSYPALDESLERLDELGLVPLARVGIVRVDLEHGDAGFLEARVTK